MADKKPENERDPAPETDFEHAITQTKFGLFNFLLFLVAIPSVFASQAEVSALSFVFPAAQCDLNLSLNDRGLLNAITYIGMIITCFVWGSLTDIFGRRRILIISHAIDCLFVIMATFAPSVSVLIAVKFLGGAVINGPAMALAPYMSEFHATNYRSRIPLIIGLTYSLGNIYLPLLAWAILRIDIELNIFNVFDFHAWNLFLFICSLPAFISGVGFFLLPESPKYLMSKGENEEALKIFSKVFHCNTGKPLEEFPVKKLQHDQQINAQKMTVKQAWIQLSPLFSSRYRTKLVLVCLLQLFWMMTVNSLRLWLPEIFQIINDYEFGRDGPVSFCQILNALNPSSYDDDVQCSMNFDNSSVYVNSVIVAVSTVVGYLTAAFCVNKVGKKRILIISNLVSAFSIGSVFFAPNSTIALVLICIYIASACVCIDVVIIFVVDLFPTQLRASALSLALMCGRIGSVLGNMTLPILLQIGCAALFSTLGCVAIGATTFAVFLPNTDQKALK